MSYSYSYEVAKPQPCTLLSSLGLGSGERLLGHFILQLSLGKFQFANLTLGTDPLPKVATTNTRTIHRTEIHRKCSVVSGVEVEACTSHTRQQHATQTCGVAYCGLISRWKIASDLQFQAAIFSTAQNPFFLRDVWLRQCGNR